VKKSIDKINQGLFDLIIETKDGGNEALIARSKAINNIQALLKNLQLHTQRRLTSKLQPDPDGQISNLFARFTEAMEAIK
jgi:hypothetical protein